MLVINEDTGINHFSLRQELKSPAHKIIPGPGYGLDLEAGKVTEGIHKPPDYGRAGLRCCEFFNWLAALLAD